MGHASRARRSRVRRRRRRRRRRKRRGGLTRRALRKERTLTMRITRLRIKNYRSIEQLDEKIPPKGAIAKGGNARGKTTVLRAVRAAFLARDIAPDAIREGTDRAE